MKFCSSFLIIFVGFFSVLLPAMEQSIARESNLFELEIEVERAKITRYQQKKAAEEAERYYQQLKQLLEQARSKK